MFMEKWNKKFKDTKHPWPGGAMFGQVYNGCMFFFEAVKKANSIDPEAVIKAWEGMEYEGVMGKMTMRACDHQTLQPLIISEIQAKSEFYPFPYLGKPVIIPAERVALPPNETGNPRCK
jgi:branched-chain amino acid transport system substrate-binding protein